MEEKKPKNKKTNKGGSYKFKIAKKYNKPQTKVDKIANRRRKKINLQHRNQKFTLFLIHFNKFKRNEKLF